MNPGLVHYHFGSLETLAVATAMRHSERLLARRAEALSGDGPFIERWRAVVRVLQAELESADARIDAELRSMAWSRPPLAEHMQHAAQRWRALLGEAFTAAASEYGMSPAAVEPLVTLVATVTVGLADEQLAGVDRGHAQLLEWFEGIVGSLAG